MKYYNPNQIFLASVGNTTSIVKNGKNYTHLEIKGFGFFKEKHYSEYKYIDIFSNAEYIDFNSIYCSPGDRAIHSPVNLVSFMQKHYNDYKKIDWLEKIANKIISTNSISESELKKLLLFFNGQTTLKKETKSNIKIYSNLYKKKYKLQPCFERSKELNELILALPEKNAMPILVGEHGTGKTTIVDGLLYRIQQKFVPDFLRKQKVFELNIANLICNSDKEEKLINLIAHCIKNNIILFIDDIEKLIEPKLYDIIKEAIKRKNLKVIGTTTIDNYNKYFLNSEFNKILVNEPSDEELDKIIRGVISNYGITNKITCDLEDMDIFINGLIAMTNINNRNMNTNNKIEEDKSYNPYLVCKIIDKMFAHAIANNQTSITKEDAIYAINSCDKIKDNVKEIFINDIENLYIEEKTKRKTI